MKVRALTMSLALLLILSGCSLLPREKERRPAPILQQEERSIYTFTAVRRGDVVRTVRATAQVLPMQSEVLSFSDDSASLAAVFVNLGSKVRTGDVLAKLEDAALREQVLDLQSETKQKDLERTYRRTLDQIELERAQLALSRSYDAASRAAQTQAIQALEESHAAQGAQLDLEYEALSQELERQETKLAGFTLTAGMDGVVSRIAPDRRSYTVSDLTDCLLRIDSKLAPDFPVGTEVTVRLDDQEELCKVLSAAQAGQEPDGSVYLRPRSLNLSASSRCEVSYVAETAVDALYLSTAALREENGKSCVYLLGEDGLITTRPVELGVVGDGIVQILSGLSLDEQVILSY